MKSKKKTRLVQKLLTKLKSKYGIYNVFDLLPYRWRHWYWDNIKPFIKPEHKRLRKAIPKRWQDISSLIVNLNFELIKAFYEDEYKFNTIDWKGSSEGHAKFEQWLKKAYKYITVERPMLESRLTEAYPPLKPFNEMFQSIPAEKGEKIYRLIDDGIPYKVKYKDVISLEKRIQKKDTKIIIEMIGLRNYFWT